jgi:hypothetical protein
VILVDHLAAAAGLAIAMKYGPRASLAFVAGSTLIDLDHYPSAARRYGITSLLEGARYGLTGRIPSWDANDPRYPLHVRRPFHNPTTVASLAFLAWRWPSGRPLVLGMLVHLLLDAIDMLNARLTK